MHNDDDDESSSLPLVLAVESNDDNLLLLMTALEGLPCQVLAAIDGKRALAIARTYRPCLIVTEIILPSLDGFGLLEKLQASPDLKTIPIIALTVMASEGDRASILEAGFSHHLSKPYVIEELRSLVCQYLC